jgi:hypothetical protein
MSDKLQALLTIVGNIGGYALAFVVVTYGMRRSGKRSYAAGFPAAATALFFLWVATLTWYVWTELLQQGYRHMENIPLWLQSSNGIAENIQSEVIQVWLAALIFKHLNWPGSPESKE